MILSDDKSTLLLVDGSSFLYRAYHALPPLTNSRGEPTGAVYGVINMLKRILGLYQPQYVAVVFDAPGKTFRDDMFERYKQHRPPMPDDLRSQVEPLLEFVEAMGMPVLREPGVEADDVIGTLAVAARRLDFQVLIASGDKDLAQLVDGGVALINSSDNTLLDADGVQAKFGVRPERIIDYLALMGDKVDNIPGVPGVGPKTAAKWLAEYGSFQGVLDNADKVGGKIGEKLRAALPELPLSYELARVRCDLPLLKRPDELVLAPENVPVLVEMCRRLEFKTWLSELSAPTVDVQAAVEVAVQSQLPKDYEVVLTEERLQWWLQKLRAASIFAFDTETTSLNYMQARVVGLSFAVEPGSAAYVPVAHDYIGAPDQLPREYVLEQLQPLLEDEGVAKLGHNLKYDRNVLANHGVTLRGIRHDSMIESYVLNSVASRHDLDTLCEMHLGHRNISFEEVAGKGAKQMTFNQVELSRAGEYAAEDADMCLRLHQSLWPKLEVLERQRCLYDEIEIPLIPVLSDLERNGVLVDARRLREHGCELGARMVVLEAKAHQLAGQPFNLGSPKQIQELLYEKQGLPVLRKTPGGQPSTAEDVLQELAEDYPLPKVILEYRSVSKLKSTYTDVLPTQIAPDTGRVHTSYHQAVASTGRLSSADPNLQNIPVRSEEGRRIRAAFIAPPGHVILSCDYSQIELRIMAHLSQDAGLCSAFERNLDVHRATAAEVFSVVPESVTSDQRRAAKAINFGLIYGMSAFGLARQLGIDRSAAQAYVDLYFERYPGVKAYMDRTRVQAREQGYVETVFGRRLYLPDIRARDAQRRQYAERTAINAPMQGTAADIIKRAMLRAAQHMAASGNSGRMIMQVHDELVFEVKCEALQGMRLEIVQLMEGAAALSVPLKVDAGSGASWDEAHQ